MATPPSDLHGTTVHRAKLVEWNSGRGFGFADDGRRRIFLHVREFADRSVEPKVGATVTFVLGSDKQGRPCGQCVRLVGYGRSLRAIHIVVLVLLLILPAFAVYRVVPTEMARGLGYWSAAVSFATFFFYFEDKRRAKGADWRAPESFLHVLELIGGWPGAFLAQQRLRHKSSKFSYLFTFWFIVGIHHYLAIDAQLNWRLFHTARFWVQTSI